MTFKTSNDCSGGGSAPGAVLSSFSGGWDEFVTTTFNTGASTGSLDLAVRCTAPFGSSYTVRVDNFYAGEGLVPVELMSFSVD